MNGARARGLVISAPASGSGKTTVTLSILRRLARQGVAVASAKAGPDYIDPAFHAAASGRPCATLDPWAMRRETILDLASATAEGVEHLVVEGAMGLFDGAGGGGGSTADLAALLGLPVLLVVDARGQWASTAALVHGFTTFRADVEVAGVILNRVASDRHETLLRRALEAAGFPVLGAVPRSDEITLPSRHLGLVQAEEHPELDVFLDRAADRIGSAIDLDALRRIAKPLAAMPHRSARPAIPPLGSRIAVARDEAFAFAYDHLLQGWRDAGAEVLPFSPLADEAPEAGADALFLPGGYPELHAGRLAAAERFRSGVRALAERGGAIYGECGGYMVLGRAIVDAEGTGHRGLDLLALTTSFATRRLSLGYRRAVAIADLPFAPAGAAFRGHEFHYATIVDEDDADRLFEVADSEGQSRGAAGHVRNRVCGSFLHLVDREVEP